MSLKPYEILHWVTSGVALMPGVKSYAYSFPSPNSRLLAAGLAVPFSKLFSYGVGVGFLSMPLADAFSSSGLYLWFIVAVLLSALASFLPAWHAASLTVRDVLAYE